MAISYQYSSQIHFFENFVKLKKYCFLISCVVPGIYLFVFNGLNG